MNIIAQREAIDILSIEILLYFYSFKKKLNLINIMHLKKDVKYIKIYTI